MYYDFVGDVHGCYNELLRLMERLGYTPDTAPRGRQLIFVGDHINKGPDNVRTLKAVMAMHRQGIARSVRGNHDHLVKRVLQGKQRCPANFRKVVNEIKSESPQFVAEVVAFLKGLPKTLELEGGICVVHGACCDDRRHGNADRLALFGATSEDGQVCQEWARRYHGRFQAIVRGHTAVPAVSLITSDGGSKIYNVDTGCVYGGSLSALRLPEMEVVRVPAERMHAHADWDRLHARMPKYAMMLAA